MSRAVNEQAGERELARLRVAAERDHVPAVLAFVREMAVRSGLESGDAARLERALAAVCDNVVEHAFGPGEAASFDVVVARRPGHLVFAVEDRGPPFDFTRLEADSASGTPARPLAGLAALVRFVSLGAHGNRVEIAARLPFPAIDAYIASGAVPAPVTAAAGAPAAAPGPVTLRLMTAEDAVALARCTYAVYGYTLPDDYLYVPDRLREMLHGGLLEVCVGLAPDGEIVSYLTAEVERPGAAVAYLGEGLVDPRFRHHGLLDEMLAFMRRRAAERELLGLYAEAVTVHPYSQKSNLAAGFSEMGVQIGDEMPTAAFDTAPATAKARTPTVVTYLRTGASPRRPVYAPPAHRAMLERLYARGGYARDFLEAPAAASDAGATRLHVDVFPEWSEATIRVAAYGPDVVSQVRARLRELCNKRIDWIALDLPLSDPGTGRHAAALETLGFFFAGVLPDLVDDDVLRLQYLNEVEADVVSARIASDFGAELFAYVVRAMGEAASGQVSNG